MMMIRSLMTLLLLAGAVALAPGAVSAQTTDEFDCEVDESEIQVKYSLYFENYRAQNFEAALPDLEWVLACAPGYTGRTPDARNFRRGVEVHVALSEAASDPAARQRHLDRALELIESAVPTLQDAGGEVSEHEWLIRKGHFLQTHQEAFPERMNQACASYTQAFELDAEATDDFYLQVIAFCRAEEAADGTAEEKRAARTYMEEELMPHIDDQSVRDYVQGQAERLITTPREQFAFLYERYQERGIDDLSESEIEELFRVNQQSGRNLITEDESMQLDRELRPIVAELRPSFSIFTSLANSELRDNNFDQAVTYFERALELADEASQRADTYYNIARVKQQQNQLRTAANYVERALGIDRSHGESLFLMGSLIQSSIPRGGDARQRAAYWCAADYFQRAAAQGVTNARSAAQSAARGGPTPEEYIFLGWRPGDTVRGDWGWGSCNTTVR